jgi:hypothetical protein
MMIVLRNVCDNKVAYINLLMLEGSTTQTQTFESFHLITAFNATPSLCKGGGSFTLSVLCAIFSTA